MTRYIIKYISDWKKGDYAIPESIVEQLCVLNRRLVKFHYLKKQSKISVELPLGVIDKIKNLDGVVSVEEEYKQMI